ncbi:cell division protein FtsZ [Prevotella sp.]|uniref:cell division protein FtsZ n=1 Tax=Prevotella sp. TaxID=59823 RepID=UPI002649C685|nr:cell division protein FtsZ [Prevotella sp.]MDN5553284.1 cell division protein FtsZ [Prevotella sp.]
MEDFEEKNDKQPLVDFGPIEDKSKGIIKVIGVGGGGCNAVNNMYREGIVNVTFAVLNTDSQSLQKSPVTVKLPLGDTGLGAGANPEIGKDAAMSSIEQIHKLLDDGTKMVFITAGMGGGTGTGAAPIIAGEAKKMGILTIGIVTIPFYFEKRKKIIKALHGVEEMRKNVDALLIINNERICDIFSNEEVAVKDAFKRADQILSDATKSISELITVQGDINLDFCDVESTLRGGGGAIMAMGQGEGEHRVEKSVVDALDSPLIYGNEIDKAKRILLNIYTSKDYPLLVSEMNEIDQFMDALDPNIDVIWGVSNDNTLGKNAKVTILATGFEEDEEDELIDSANDNYFESLIEKLYKPYKRKIFDFGLKNENEFTPEPTVEYEPGDDNDIQQNYDENELTEDKIEEEEPEENNSITFKISAEDNTTSKIADEPRKEISDNNMNVSDKQNFDHHKASLLDKAKFLMGKITELTQDPE